MKFYRCLLLKSFSLLAFTSAFGCKTTANQDSNPMDASANPQTTSFGNGEKRQNHVKTMNDMERSNKYEGLATIFSTFGGGGGGCGPSEEVIMKETGGRKAWAALNVFNTPGYDEGTKGFNPHAIPRPIPDSMREYRGLYHNGKNCGRWIRVHFPFLDKIHSTTFVVTDSCGDGNLWCRDDPAHVDLSVYEVAQLVVPDRAKCYTLEDARRHQSWNCYNFNWRNSKVSWEYIEPPHDNQSILFHWHNGAKKNWRSVVVTRLKNGISGIEVKTKSGWTPLANEADAAQRFQLSDKEENYEVRVKDRLGTLYPGSYKFSFPINECNPTCGHFKAANLTFIP